MSNNLTVDEEYMQPQKAKSKGGKKKKGDSVVIELPKSEVDETGYVGRSMGRIDIRLTAKQRVTFRRIYSGLRESGATLEDGKLVDSPGAVVRWMFEQAYEESD